MKTKKKRLDFHEGLSWNQCQIILDEFGLDSKDFGKWIGGQGCPIVPRDGKNGIVERLCGYFEYDLFRYINWKRRGVPLTH